MGPWTQATDAPRGSGRLRCDRIFEKKNPPCLPSELTEELSVPGSRISSLRRMIFNGSVERDSQAAISIIILFQLEYSFWNNRTFIVLSYRL